MVSWPASTGAQFTGGSIVNTAGLLGGCPDASIALAWEGVMPTLTIRNVPTKVVQSLKALARRRNHSMEQEVRELLQGYLVERRSVLDQIEAGWARQARRPTAREIDSWMDVGRP